MLHTTIGELDLDDKHQFGVDYILRNAGLGISPIILNTANNTANANGTTTTTGTTTSTTSTTTGTTTGLAGTSIRPSDLIGFNGNQRY